jgi:tetratricopeptide (TPR) repeat protein
MRINEISFSGTENAIENKYSDDTLTLLHSYQSEKSIRGKSDRQRIELAEDSVVEFIFDDGTTWLASPDTLEDVFPDLHASKRSAEENVFEIPEGISSERSDRGLVSKVLLKTLNIFSKKLAEGAVHKLAHNLEDKQLEEKTGLFALNRAFELTQFVPDENNKPWLLLIHGTATSVKSDFGNAPDSALMNFIRGAYKERVLAFQRRTLTENPLQNVRDLVHALPVNCFLHILTTSGGGLVGEVLSRFCNQKGNIRGFSPKEMEILKNGYPKEYYEELEKLIKEITQIVENKKIVIEKFIRVACPAGGAVLASKRLDHFLNITLNLVGIGMGSSANPVFNAFRSLISAIIGCKNKWNVLSGLEVQSPRSPFIKAINWLPVVSDQGDRIVIDNSLVIISGNSRATLKLKALVIIASKLFFWQKNDLIVETSTMSKGTPRSGLVQQFLIESPDIDHFKYLKNDSTCDAILSALESDWGKSFSDFKVVKLTFPVGQVRGTSVKPDDIKISRNKVSGNNPIVLLIPGFLGSTLSDDSGLLWINYPEIASGRLATLSDNNNIRSEYVLSGTYKQLIESIEGICEVVTFSYDWRLPFTNTAEKLNKKVEELLKYNQPVKIIAHEAGGVVFRDFMVTFPVTWSKLKGSRGFRIIFLGTPFNGTYRIPGIFLGKDPLIDKLDQIDLVNSRKEIIKLFSGFKGLLGLMPFSEGKKQDFSDIDFWNGLKEANDEEDFQIPSEEDLQWFKSYRDQMKNGLRTGDFDNGVYIAGRGRLTPCGFRIEEKTSGNELQLLGTSEGDQEVTWESGIPPEMIKNNSVYYVDIPNSSLTNRPLMWEGIKEILVKGATSRFRNIRPPVRGKAPVVKVPESRIFDSSIYGIDNSLEEPESDSTFEGDETPIIVSISHGDLFYSSYPVMAGHFSDDSILTAEKVIDRYLKGALDHKFQIGNYPGAIGTSEVFFSDLSGFRGAVIIGLGIPENLTAAELTKSVEQGTINYMLHRNTCTYTDASTSDAPELLGISTLIIGSGYGGLSIENSIKAIIKGVHDANEKVKNLSLNNLQLISIIEFVELHEDKAINTLYTLSRIENQETWSIKIVLKNKKINTLLGSRKRIPNESVSDWWNRITVSKDDKKKKTVEHIKFNASTGGALEKEKVLLSNPQLIEGMIENISTEMNWSARQAKAIFELLIPNDFKEQLKKHGDMYWIVDHYTASFPWELLQDKSADSKPLCVMAGMIRKLASENFRQGVKTTTCSKALVIAEPELKGFLPPLAGAAEEGGVVAEILKEHQIETTTSFKDDYSEIVEKLFSDDYKIIHLAGHGVFDPKHPENSGMVIGKGLFLTTRQIQQMSTVPDLVFVNCCHIGKTEGVAEEYYHKRYQMAANIGTQLIENGVKCVVAAGWSVNDYAGLDFARVFYESMFNGYNFGESIKEARKYVYEEHPNTNTWGAYQCYGDPFFKIDRIQKKWTVQNKTYLISQEAEIDLSNLYNELEIRKSSPEEYLQRLNSISKEITDDIRNPSIVEKQALIFLELMEYDKACEKFEELLKTEDASFSFSVAEKYYNAMAKKTVKDFIMHGKKESEKYLDNINDVIKNLNNLINISPTSARFNILASSYKRKGFLIMGKENKNKLKAYEEAAKYYQKGNANSGNWYSLTNWLSLESILTRLNVHRWETAITDTNGEDTYTLPSLDKAVTMLNESGSNISTYIERMSYWDMLKRTNIDLCRYVLLFPGEKVQKDFNRILDDIRILWGKAGSKGKHSAEIEHLDFLIDALTLTENDDTNELKRKLKQLRGELVKLTTRPTD